MQPGAKEVNDGRESSQDECLQCNNVQVFLAGNGVEYCDDQNIERAGGDLTIHITKSKVDSLGHVAGVTSVGIRVELEVGRIAGEEEVALSYRFCQP